MSGCGVRHRSPGTAMRCSNRECRAEAARVLSRSGVPQVPTTQDFAPAMPMRVIPDARGKPVSIPRSGPAELRRLTVSPQTIEALGSGGQAGSTFKQCKFAPGAYVLTDVTLEGCEFAEGTTLILGGQSVVTGSELRGHVRLAGETVSDGNVYASSVVIADSVVILGGDHMAKGYEVAEGDPTVHRAVLAAPPSDGPPVPAVTPTPSITSRAGRIILEGLARQLATPSHRRRSRRRR